MKVTFTRAGVQAGFRSAAPLGLPVAAYGAVYGLLAQQAGVSALEATLMNIFVFAGAAQMAVLPYWDFPLPVFTMALTTFLINLRLVLLTASLRPWLKYLPNKLVYPLLYNLSDESWTVAMTRYRLGERDAGVVLGCNLVVIVAWIPAAVVGFALGDRIPAPERFGLDFALTAVFASMLFAGYRSRHDLAPWIASAIAAVVVWMLIPGTWYVVAGGIAGVVTAVIKADPSRHVDVLDAEVAE
jgi:4-azaleucine resistance transporter AzlC